MAREKGVCRSSNLGVLQQQLWGVATATNLGGVAAVKGGVALDRPNIYIYSNLTGGEKTPHPTPLPSAVEVTPDLGGTGHEGREGVVQVKLFV